MVRMKPPTSVPVRCPECGTTVALPVTRSLIVGNTASIYVDRGPLDEHQIAHEAEKILEDA